MDEKNLEKPMEEKIYKVIPESTVTNEKYDVSEPWLDVVAIEEDEVEGITFTYGFTGDEVAKALKIFQKKMIRKKNLIYTCVFLIVEILYLGQIAKNPDYTMGKILAMLCIIAIIYIWYMPWNHIRSIKAATEQMESPPTFEMTVNEKGLINKDEKGYPFLIPFTEEKMKAVETSDLFVMMVSKEKCFVVPKRCLTPEEAEGVSAVLKAGLGARYEYQVK